MFPIFFSPSVSSSLFSSSHFAAARKTSLASSVKRWALGPASGSLVTAAMIYTTAKAWMGKGLPDKDRGRTNIILHMSPLLASAALLPPRLGFLSLPLPVEWAALNIKHQFLPPPHSIFTSLLRLSSLRAHIQRARPVGGDMTT